MIRLEVRGGDTPTDLEALVREGLGADEALVAESDRLHRHRRPRRSWSRRTGPTSNSRPTRPRFPERIIEHDGDCFAAIRAKDIIVHHPYESFEVVVAFLRQAAADPDVVAIKQTLYRAGKQSAVIDALVAAAEAGKSVTAVVELKARFDEEQNLLWASRARARRGPGRSTASSSGRPTPRCRWSSGARAALCAPTATSAPAIIIRRRRASTPTSAIFTADPARRRAMRPSCSTLTGYVEPQRAGAAGHLAARHARQALALIDARDRQCQRGQAGGDLGQDERLVDRSIIDKLYEASEAGVAIELIVRGICCLRPGVPGLSANIRVKSIVGRFLEHSRIFVLRQWRRAAEPQGASVYISSADWMPRNFDRRVEYMLPIENPTVHAQVLDQVMIANLIDNEQSWRAERRWRLHQARSPASGTSTSTVIS